MARDTTTGRVLEEMVLPPLNKGGYQVMNQFNIGTRLGGGKHMVDILAIKDGRQLLISLKWQQVNGTAEQKVPFEYMCLANALTTNPEFNAAYIVIGGNGWTKHRFFIDELDEWVNTRKDVNVVSLVDFVAAANTGSL